MQVKTKKICPKCKKNKKLSFFSKDKKRKDGLQSQCKDCKNIYKNTHYSKNKEQYRARFDQRKQELKQWYKEYKQTLSCSICGESHPACIQFHHEESREKDYNITYMVNRHNFCKEKILEEIKKCQVVCANCHLKIHNSQFFKK